VACSFPQKARCLVAASYTGEYPLPHPWQQEHRYSAVTFGRPNDSRRRSIRRRTGTPPDPQLLHVIARAWWLDRGDVATIRGTAVAMGVTEPFVSRFLRLAYLAPEVLEGLSIRRRPCALSLDRLAVIAIGAAHRAARRYP
jgi:hypothetical protein